MGRKTVKKPRVFDIFAPRFLVLLGLFTLISIYVIYMYYAIISNQLMSETQDYLDNIAEAAIELANTSPDSEEYKDREYMLNMRMNMFQEIGPNGAEVHIGDKVYKADENAAYLIITNSDMKGCYSIRDISYIERLNEVAGKEIYAPDMNRVHSWGDVIAEELSSSSWQQIRFESVYINKDTRTFMPGIVCVSYGAFEENEAYTYDLTPEDVSGYEYVDLTDVKCAELFFFSYCEGISDAVYDSYYVSAGEDNYRSVFSESEINDTTHEWYMAYTQGDIGGPFDVAPWTCCFIIVICLILTFAISGILTAIRYSKDKAVWEIFEYRRKTTEAMAHDLKTPLAALMAYTESIEANPEKASSYLARINEHVESLDRKIGQILELSRGENGEVTVNKEEFSLKALLEESLKSYPDMAANINGEDIKLNTDRNILRQAIDNLLSNCSRYRSAQSPVDIVIGDKTLTITNKTDAKAENPEELRKPFVKGDRSRGQSGSGLGLAIADSDLDILGYKMDLASSEGEFKVTVRFR